ncbi:MAG: hypothetical protein IJB43_03720 [Clostridia bacterium]|nr:hypothetical protein [Clostridia bacterium]
MNNVIDRNYTPVSRREERIYNEALGERIISFLCLVIAFFENNAVDAVCRMIGAVAIAIACFFYVSGVMAGTLSVLAIAFYGALIIAASAFVFRTKSVSSR